MVTNIYRLRPIPDDPRFEGFGIVDKSSLFGNLNIYRDFNYFDPANRHWSPLRFAPVWKPLRVFGNVKADNDYPGIGGSVPAFSSRAVEALRIPLEKNGELLSLENRPELGRYFAYNVTSVIDALDPVRSQVERYSKSYVAMRVIHHEFDLDKSSERDIFRLCDVPPAVFVTDNFVRIAEESGLRGMHFQKVWPLPPGTEWLQVAMAELHAKYGSYASDEIRAD